MIILQKRHITLLILLLVVTTINSQEISVVDLVQMTKKEMRTSSINLAKDESALVLVSSRQGFRFKQDGKPVDAEQDDGMIILHLPAKTSSLTITHDEYGTCQWKIPSPGLKKKKAYKAILHTSGSKKEYKNDKQWLILNIKPARCIVTIDSTLHHVNTGQLSLQLPVGKHSLTVESPFYEAANDTLTLDDRIRAEKFIELAPYFAYLTVNSNVPNAEIKLDGKLIGKGTVATNRIVPGCHELSANINGRQVYRDSIVIENASRKIIYIDKKDLDFNGVQNGGNNDMQNSSLTILAPDSLAEIWVNREIVGKGQWQGNIPAGVYGISCMKDSLETPTTYIKIMPGEKKNIQLPSPSDFYGVLDVSSNITGAAIYINGNKMGKTPCIFKKLPTTEKYTITVEYNGKRKKTVVSILGNDITKVVLDF